MGKVRSGEELKEYRQSYNYRAEYFKRNPGFFGCIWFCSQCYRPLFGKGQVVIDHIVPLAKGGRNHVSNCTAICQKCNREKSDKVDGRVLKGKAFKAVESTVFKTQRGAGAALGVGVGLTAAAVNGVASTGAKVAKGTAKTGARVGGSLIKSAFRGITYPLRKGSIVSRLFFLAVYVAIIVFLLGEYTPLLDPWLH